MKKLRNLVAMMAMMGMATFMTGCGDDDDDDDDAPAGPNIVAPADVAQLTAQNKVYTAQVNGQQVELRFPSAGNYTLTTPAGTETGTISGQPVRTDNTWTINIAPTAGQQGAREGVLRLNFNTANAGTWEFTPTGGTAEAGTFTLTDNNGSTDGGTDGTTDGGTPGGGTGDDLTGKTLQINYTGGGGDKFEFTSATAVSWENGTQTGTYTYNSTAGTLNVVLNDGQNFEISGITAGSSTGSTTVQYRADPGAEPQSFAGNYSLTP